MNPGIRSFLARLVQPLRSRKVRVALATVLAAYLADWGLDVSDTVLYGIIGVGAAIIGGIALEDAGTKAGGLTVVDDDDDKPDPQ